jgi:hypothetical protein
MTILKFIISQLRNKETKMSNLKITNGSSLTPHQQTIFDGITSIIDAKISNILKSTNIHDSMISLSGAAGTGKTFLTAQIAKYLTQKNSKDYSFVVTAPTHKAVSVIANILSQNNIETSAKTIHSFLGIKPFIDYEKGVEKFSIDKTKKTKETTSILIVDESSMIGAELFEYISEAIEERRVMVVLFIGDPYQLLPVDKSQNEIFQLQNSFELTEVVRQAKDSYIINIATNLRERIQNQNFIPLVEFFMTQNHKELQFFNNEKDFIDDFYKNDKWYEEDKILATYKNQDVDGFNRRIRAKYWAEKGCVNPKTLQQGDTLRFKEAYSVNGVSLYHNGQIVKIANAEMKYHESLEIYYWECQVINSPTQQIFRVVDPGSLKVFNDKLNLLAQKAKSSKYPERNQLWTIFYATRDMFADVQYIHSSTIHKLQGSTHDVSYVDLFSLSDNFYMCDDEKYRLAYVAITRAKNDVKIFLPSFGGEEQKYIIDSSKKFLEVDDLLKGFNFL